MSPPSYSRAILEMSESVPFSQVPLSQEIPSGFLPVNQNQINPSITYDQQPFQLPVINFNGSMGSATFNFNFNGYQAPSQSFLPVQQSAAFDQPAFAPQAQSAQHQAVQNPFAISQAFKQQYRTKEVFDHGQAKFAEAADKESAFKLVDGEWVSAVPVSSDERVSEVAVTPATVEENQKKNAQNFKVISPDAHLFKSGKEKGQFACSRCDAVDTTGQEESFIKHHNEECKETLMQCKAFNKECNKTCNAVFKRGDIGKHSVCNFY